MPRRLGDLNGRIDQDVFQQVASGKSDAELAQWLDQRLGMTGTEKAAFNKGFLKNAA